MKRIVGLILLLLAIAGMVNVINKFSQGNPTPSSGNAAYDQGQKVGRYTAPVVLVALGLLGLRLLLQGEGPRPAPPPERWSPTGTMPPPGHPSLRGGQNTFASNPARLRLPIGPWLAANPWVAVVSSGLALIGFVVLFIKLPVGLVLLVTAAIVFFQGVREAKQKFFMGDVCPGVVLSAEQNLVAVFTDLKAAANFPRPAIKIFRQPLHRITTEPAYDGMRVAAAALYHGDVRQPAWQDFSPEVIHCVVRDPEEIGRVLASIPQEDWQALDTYLAQIPVAKPGLYRLWNMAAPAPSATGAPPPGATRFAPAKPWFATTPALIAFSVVGALVGLVVLVNVAGWALRTAQRRNAVSHRPQTFTPPPMPSGQRLPPPDAPRSFAPTQAGPYTAGASITAQWAGKWIPGKITAINPGGFSVMVQLEDARFSRPIVLSTNQIRLR